jgi:hypothetical protein
MIVIHVCDSWAFLEWISHAMSSQALDELQPILEAWAGMELIPAIAYGFRLYRYVSQTLQLLIDLFVSLVALPLTYSFVRHYFH